MHNASVLSVDRRSLRNTATSAEAELWSYLKCSKLEGRKFRRQHSIENMIVDFYCPAERLIIELDREAHFTASGNAADVERDTRLEALGFRVLRFENCLVFTDLEAVLDDIRQQFAGFQHHPR